MDKPIRNEKCSESEEEMDESKGQSLEMRSRLKLLPHTITEEKEAKTMEDEKLSLESSYEKVAGVHVSFPDAEEVATRSKEELITVEDQSHFDGLPLEVKHEVLKRLAPSDKKTARLVCKEWEGICRDHLTFVPIMTSESFDHVISWGQKFDSMIVSGEMLNISFHNTTFVGGGNVRKIHFKNFTIGIHILKWIFASCRNLEEIRIDYSDTVRNHSHLLVEGCFLDSDSDLPPGISTCHNLKKLEIYIVPHSRRICGWWTLNCKPLHSCEHLRIFNIRSYTPFFLQNCSQLRNILERFNAMMFPHDYIHVFTDANGDSVFQSLFNQLCPSPSTDGLIHLSPTDDFINLVKLRQYLPNISAFRFFPNDSSEWEAFESVILEVKNGLSPNPNENILLTYAGLLNFSVNY